MDAQSPINTVTDEHTETDTGTHQEGSNGDPQALALQELQTLEDTWNRGPEAIHTQTGVCTLLLLYGPKRHLETSLGSS